MRLKSVIKNTCGCLFFAFLYGCGSNCNYSEKVTASNILRVDLGMSENQVVELLGPPVRGYKRDLQSYTFEYTEKGKSYYPMVWVHFDTSGSVNNVYVKYYSLIDDKGIYGLTKEGNNKKQWGEDVLKEIIR